MPLIRVQIWSQGAHQPNRDVYVDEQKLKKCSLLLRSSVNTTPAPTDGSPKKVWVTGSYGPMSTVLQQIADFGHVKKLKIRFAELNLTLVHVALLWEACEILEVVPKQYHLRQHVRGGISHNKLQPKEILDLDKVFYHAKDVKLEGENKSVWDILVHQTAWLIKDQSGYTRDEIARIQPVITERAPCLAEAISSKLEELKLAKRKHDIVAGKAARRETNRRVKGHKKAERDRRQEELRGERELSEAMAKHVITAAPATSFMTIEERKHGKRGPGNGKVMPKWLKEMDEEDEGDEQ